MLSFLKLEGQRLWQDKWLLGSISWVPILIAIFVWWIFSLSIAGSLPIAIVDHEQSVISQQFVRHLDASSTLKVSTYFSDVTQAKRALQGGDIYAYVVIPKNFDRDIYLSNPPQVSVFYNSQYILVGKLINAAVLSSVGTFDASAEVLKNLALGDTTPISAMGKAVSIRMQISPLFNSNSNYAQFLVTAIIPSIWQIVIVVGTILTLAMHRRLGSFSAWKATGVASNMIKTLACYLPIYLLLGACFLVGFYHIVQWPMHGSLWILLIAQIFTIIACMIVGTFFYFLTFDAARSMSLAGAFTAPGFAFLGITFPVSDMTVLAQFWRGLLPISYYVEAQVSQASYGTSFWQTTTHMFPMLWCLLVVLVLMKLVPMRLQEVDR